VGRWRNALDGGRDRTQYRSHSHQPGTGHRPHGRNHAPPSADAAIVVTISGGGSRHQAVCFAGNARGKVVPGGPLLRAAAP
jgi:hypothetical protein